MGEVPPELVERAQLDLQAWVEIFSLAGRLADGMAQHIAEAPLLAADSADQLRGLLGDLAMAPDALGGLLEELDRYLPSAPE